MPGVRDILKKGGDASALSPFFWPLAFLRRIGFAGQLDFVLFPLLCYNLKNKIKPNKNQAK